MLVVKPHRKLLLNLKEPARVTTVVPTARMVEVHKTNKTGSHANFSSMF